MRRVLRGLSAIAIFAGLTAGCAEIEGNIGSRADNFNRTVADYSNEATLLNLVRAGNSEPLTFVGITGTTGHNTLTGNMGLPTLTVGPEAPVGALNPVRNYSFGPNTLSGSQSSDFTLSVTADPGTYAALLTPLDVPTMSYFYEIPIPPDELLLLFVHHFIVTFADHRTQTFYSSLARSFDLLTEDGSPRPSHTASRLEEVWCVPSAQEDQSTCVESPPFVSGSRRCFVDTASICRTADLLAYSYLALQGLTFKTERGSIPGQSTRPASLICFDPTPIRSTFARTFTDGAIRAI
jgi:hypothetical protein